MTPVQEIRTMARSTPDTLRYGKEGIRAWSLGRRTHRFSSYGRSVLIDRFAKRF